MELLRNRANYIRPHNVLRLGVVAVSLLCSACSIVPESSQRYDARCNEDPVEAEFNDDNKAIFIATLEDADTAAIIVTQNGEEYLYTVDPYGQPDDVEFVDPVSRDGTADVDALAVYGVTEFKITVDPNNSSAELSVSC